jgi:uncharacterized protein
MSEPEPDPPVPPGPSGLLPMFPLGSVLFPGTSVPLHVFEDRYRALVRHLLDVEDPAERLFGSVAIREGYEVGEHGAQSLYRVGVRLQLTEVEPRDDGTYAIEAVARDRFRLDGLDTSGLFPAAHVRLVPDGPATGAAVDEAAAEARAVFTAYRAALQAFREDPVSGSLPEDAEWLGWLLAAAAPLPMAERQGLLEAEGTAERLRSVTELLRAELRAMNVVPSMPATELARTRWSPN